MNENELMLGDWVHMTDKDVNARVTELRSDGHDALVVTDHGEVDMLIDLEPIPLTEYILSKNGFKNDEILPYEWTLFTPCSIYTVRVCLKKQHTDVNVYTTDVYHRSFLVKRDFYVHDLQHAMRMCGIEKEIEL